MGELLKLFVKLGFSGFGGPLAHFAMMEAEAVEGRKWLTKERFLEGWAVCQILPGPASTQLGVYIGYVKGGFFGASVSGLAFVLPGFLIILTLSALYARYGTIPQVQGIFYGIGPAVLAIIAFSCYRLGTSAITTLPLLGLGIAAFLLTFFFHMDPVLILVGAGLIGILLSRLPLRGGVALFTALALPAPTGSWTSTLGTLSWIFLKAGAFVYGGGYVIIPFVQQEVVERLGWMTVKVFLDGLALGQLTPGPIVNISAFVGYQVAGVPGAAVGAASVFLPAFAAILLAVKIMDRLREAPSIKAFLKGVNAAVVGAILGASIPLAQGALVDLPTLAIAIFSFVILWRFKVDTVYLVLASGLIGLLLH